MGQVISLSDAAALSNNLLVEGIIEDIITYDEWFRYLPFVVFSGLSYTFNRETTLAAADFAAPGTSLAASNYQNGMTTTPINVNLTAIIGEIIIDGQIEDQLSETNDQLQAQISSKSKAIARSYMNAVVNAVRTNMPVQSNNGVIGIDNKFNGMKSILDAEQGNVQDVNHPFYNLGQPTQTGDLVEDDSTSARHNLEGRVFTLEDLDNLIDRVTAGKPDFMMMNSREIRTLRVLLRNTGGGTDAYQIQQQGLGNMKPMLYYQDIPVFRNDFVSKVDPVNLRASYLLNGGSSANTSTSFTVHDWSQGFLPAGQTIEPGDTVIVQGTDGNQYRWPYAGSAILTGSQADTTSLTVSTSQSFFNPQLNMTLMPPAPNAAGLFANGATLDVYERIDGSQIIAGCWGEFKGVVGFTSANNAGLKLEYVGPREDENAYQYRLKWYCGFDLYNRLALARISSVLPLGS
jgi:hypothetical protein